jgi:hypothetical protein
MVIRALSGVLYGLSEKHIPHDLLTTLDTVGIGQAVLIIVVGIVWLLRMLATRTKPVAEGPTWGCGFQEGDARIQYTATTYADSTIEIMSPVTDVSVSYRHIDPADMFPRTRSYHTEEKDLIANKVLDPLAIGVERVLRALAVLQSGNMRSYILYAFVFIVVVVVLTLAEVL